MRFFGQMVFKKSIKMECQLIKTFTIYSNRNKEVYYVLSNDAFGSGIQINNGKEMYWIFGIYRIYGREAYRGDQWLFHQSNNSEKIMSLLAESQAYPIENHVVQTDVEKQKKHILSEQYKDKADYDIRDHRYCTESVTISFIDECVDELKDVLVI